MRSLLFIHKAEQPIIELSLRAIQAGLASFGSELRFFIASSHNNKHSQKYYALSKRSHRLLLNARHPIQT